MSDSRFNWPSSFHAAAERSEFAPPPQRGLIRAFLLAVIAHGLLVLALMHGLQWKREAENVAAEAELWSAVPQQAAPRQVEPPPPVPVPTPPVVQAPPVVKAPPEPEPPARREADIAAEREQQKSELAERKQAELEREREKRKKLEAQKKREEELARKQEQARVAAAAEKRKLEEDKKRKAEADAKRLAQQREDNLKRIQAMAGTGAPSATGNAARSSGTSSSYAGRLAALFKRHMNFPTMNIVGNPKAEVQVRIGPSGTILSVRLVKPSGNPTWDEAVLRAIQATERVPADENGRFVPEFPLTWGPKD